MLGRAMGVNIAPTRPTVRLVSMGCLHCVLGAASPTEPAASSVRVPGLLCQAHFTHCERSDSGGEAVSRSLWFGHNPPQHCVQAQISQEIAFAHVLLLPSGNVDVYTL